MRDYVNIAKGGVYELLDKYGNTDGKLYLVVSDNIYQSLTSCVMVCMIGEPEISEKSQKYHVQFVMKNVKGDVPLDIIPEVLFNVKQNRLTRYKFTLNDSIMKKVSEKIMMIMTGCELYTLDEAIVKLHDIEMHRRLEYEFNYTRKEVVKDVVEVNDNINFDDLSCEDAQSLFAKSMGDEPYMDMMQTEEKVMPSSKSVNTTSKTSKPVKKKSKAKAKKSKKKKNNANIDNKKIVNFKDNKPASSYDSIYAHYEDYLIDYYSLSKEEIAKKYNIPITSIANRAYQCRQISKRNGDDQSVWNEFQKELIEKAKLGQRGVTSAKEM